MQKQVKPAPFAILEGNTNAQLWFTLEDAVFAVAIAPSGRPGAGCLLPRNSFEDATKISEALSRLVSTIGGSTPTNFKLVGDKASVEKIALMVEKLGHAVAGTSFGDSLEVIFTPSEGRLRVAQLKSEKKENPVPTAEAAPRKIKVLVVDDSKTIRELLTKIFGSDPDIDVVGCVENPLEAEAQIKALSPDVITLDIHMPHMDGLTLLKSYLARYPIPTVMISSISMEEGPVVLQALEQGAVDYIQKPSFNQLATMAPMMIEKIKAASKARVSLPRLLRAQNIAAGAMDQSTLIAIGSSTGGTEALRAILINLPKEIPPIVIVQHIPPVFSRAFAERLNQLCPFEVKEAADGDEIKAGRVLIAPGGMQMRAARNKTGLAVRVEDTPPVNRHKPSVDVLFNSITELSKMNTIAGILTGMGADGAKGLLALKQWGAKTLAQDEKTSVVFGMPKEAIRLGGVDEICALGDIAAKLVEWTQPKRRRA